AALQGRRSGLPLRRLLLWAQDPGRVGLGGFDDGRGGPGAQARELWPRAPAPRGPRHLPGSGVKRLSAALAGVAAASPPL
ncbi:unnamed protein product, partial [Rangifer tarandus platyrhynchus]